MSYHRHVLAGCTPEPLAHYLKALGILRLVSEQKDETCRGAWQDDRFVLVTTLSREELEKFFLEEYRPTAVFNPWGARSGFYPGNSEKTARTYLSRLTSSSDARFQDWRVQITAVQAVVKEHGSEKPQDKDDQYTFIADIAKKVRGSAQTWLSASVPIGPEASYKPPILGTGGNEGSGSYTSGYLQALVEALLDRMWDRALLQSLDGAPSNGAGWKGTFGQFIPTGDGTAWDLLLALEGAVAVRSSVARRSSTSITRSLSSPFLVGPWVLGTGSGAQGDENEYRNGRASAGRGEQWFPLWNRPATYAEIDKLFEDGRVAVGRSPSGKANRRTATARTPLQFAQSVASLGITRGISAFLRFGYLQRNNLATHFAVPLGRIAVLKAGQPRSRLVDEAASWLDQLHGLARAKGAPSRLAHAERWLSDAVFAALTHDDAPVQWQAILRAAVGIEALQSTGTAIKAGPIPKLSVEWLIACNDGSAEFRLATALGGAAGGYSRDNGKPFNSLRHHWLPLEDGSRRFRTSDKKLAHDVRVVAHGRDPEADLLAIIERRTIESAQKGDRHPRIEAAFGAGACLSDLTAWIAGELDTVKCVELARAFMAVDWSRWNPRTLDLTRHENRSSPEEAWGALRLNALPWPLDKERDIPFDPAIVRRLGAGDLAGAVRLALLRLAAHGIQSTIRFGLGDAALARRWGSALAFPISSHTAHCLLHQLQPQSKETHHDH
jgi:CRISPR-associated protein Csx17